MMKVPLVEKTLKAKDKSITLYYPNVRLAKENKLFRKKHGMTQDMISYNMEICGFNVVSYGEFRGVSTSVTVKCCNGDCENTAEKTYANFITGERLPLCKSCLSIVKSINKINSRPMVAVKSSEKIEFKSVAEAGRQLNISHQIVYNHLKNGKKHSSGYRFEFLD
ncbi:hypothetical protein P4J23_08215 [Bacillus cereus]|nr:hypothetical protein [Bacillus cereus]